MVKALLRNPARGMQCVHGIFSVVETFGWSVFSVRLGGFWDGGRGCSDDDCMPEGLRKRKGGSCGAIVAWGSSVRKLGERNIEE